MMNLEEVFSPEMTAHLASGKERRDYLENMCQLAWLERDPDMTETEFMERSKWFRKQCVGSSEGEALLEAFSADAAPAVLERLETYYQSTCTRH